MTAPLYGLLAEYATADALLAAVHQVRAAWQGRIDAYAPFAVDGLAEAVGMASPRVAPWTLAGGICGGVGAYALQWYSAVLSYPLNIGGRPFDSWPAFIPITFELTILGAAIAAVLAMLAQNGLPCLVHPLFAVPEFDLASRNRFYLVLRDERLDVNGGRVLLAATGALLVREVPS